MVVVCDFAAREYLGDTGVMANALHKLREWLTIGEAAQEIALALEDHVSEADVLRLAIDGHLTLSLYLPSKVAARCQRIDDESLDPDETNRLIEGICDLPMRGRAKLQIQHNYQWLLNRTYVPLDGPVGALVEQGGLLCKVPCDRGESGMSPRSQSEFPRASVLCIRRAALDEFVTHIRKKHQPSAPDTAPAPPEGPEKALGTRERTTLLTIIAALAQSAGIDTSKPSKAAESIEALTASLGARVSARSIEDHLRKIPDAVERKGKTSM